MNELELELLAEAEDLAAEFAIAMRSEKEWAQFEAARLSRELLNPA